MAKLIDLIHSFPFRCQKCDAELTSDLLLTAVVTYGVILLDGEKDGLIGWSCPGCRGLSINLIRLQKDSYNQIVDALRSTLIEKRIGKLCYRSFPYRYDLIDTDFSNTACRELNADFQTVYEKDLCYREPNFDPAGKYCSYRFGSEALGPIIFTCWHDNSQVEKLILRENKTGLKLFPRYIVHHPLYSTIDNFSYHNRIYFEDFKNLNVPLNVNVEKWLKTSKNRITKTFGFLELLDKINSYQFSLSSSSSKEIQAFTLPLTISPEVIGSFEPSSAKIHISKDVNLFKKAWAAFHTEWTQALLDNLADNFISEYLNRIGKVDCSLPYIESLNKSYLKILFDAFSSRSKLVQKREKENGDLRKEANEAEKAFPNVKIVSYDKEINYLKIQISKAAPSGLAYSFLILGERGTGKEIFAKAIHEASKQKGHLISVNCGSITEPLFESEIFGHLKGSFTNADRNRLGALGEANGGSIFFDEIGNLSLTNQGKLLRVLQEKKFVPVGSSTEKSIDAKFIFATNRNLDDMVSKDLFMPDLYDRINIFPITIPPLRDRKDDIEILTKHFINVFGTHDKNEYGDLKINKDCLEFLKSLEWPGNVRELEKVVRFIMINRIASQDKSEITELDLPDDILTKGESSHMSIQKRNKILPGNTRIEDEQIIQLMKEHGNNKTRVAEQLGVTYKTIWLRCKKLGL